MPRNAQGQDALADSRCTTVVLQKVEGKCYEQEAVTQIPGHNLVTLLREISKLSPLNHLR